MTPPSVAKTHPPGADSAREHRRILIKLFASGRPTEWVSLRDGATPLQVIAAVNRQTSWTAITMCGVPWIEPPGTYRGAGACRAIRAVVVTR